MLPHSSAGRRFLGGAAIIAASLLSVLVARGLPSGGAAASAPGFRQLGEAAAPVLIVEYSDFQCPACRVAEPPMHDILKLYGGQVRFVFKHYPLERIHIWARTAATAAECAGRQGKFWPFHDLLYSRQSDWVQSSDPPATLLQYAREVGADPIALKSCIDDPTVAAAVDADIADGKNHWVLSTPTFFVNGRRFIGAKQLGSRAPPWIEKSLKK